MATLNDVAKACNVSPMTVSCVLNNKPGRVSAATRERVLLAVRELNYHPNAMARGLTGKQLNTVGIVYLSSHEPVHTAGSFVLMLDGILDRATRLHQDTLMFTGYSWEDGMEGVSRLLDRRCDGLVVVVPPSTSPLLPVLKDHGLPTVLLCSKSEDAAFSYVDTDNAWAARALVERMLGLGHRRIAFVSHEHEHRYLYCAERYEGYRLALQATQITPDPRLSLALPHPSCAADILWALPPGERPTAIFGVTDQVALSILTAMQQKGVRVPEDVSIAGFDGIPTAALVSPGLTTVSQPLRRIGQECVDLLVACIRGEADPGQKRILPTEIVERGSLCSPQ